jgi:hypothetical protein
MPGVNGVNLDPLNIPHGRPDPALLRSLGFTWVRLVARPGVETYEHECRQAGLRTLVVLANESFAAGWVDGYMEAMSPSAWQLGNEPDQAGPSSWTMRPSEYLSLWRSIAPMLRRQGAPVVAAGLASGIPEWLAEITGELDADALCVHPYCKTAEQARDLLERYRVYGRPLWVTEWHRPALEVGEFAAMLEGQAEMAAWYAWSDGMNPGFGLVNIYGQPRSEYDAMVEAIAMASHSERIALLETQQALTVEILKLILQGRWTGAMPHAEAILKAINPNDVSWSALPFPHPEA